VSGVTQCPRGYTSTQPGHDCASTSIHPALKALISLLAAFQGLCQPFLGLSPGSMLRNQFGLDRLKRPFAALPVCLHTLDNLILRQTLMRQFRLKVSDTSVCILAGSA
jgi:hypothetical protein